MEDNKTAEENTVHTGKMPQWVRDAVYGAVIVIFAIGNIMYAQTLPPGSIKLKVAQAGTYLTGVMILLAVLGILMILRSFIRKDPTPCESIFNSPTVITIAMIALYLLLMEKLGFMISSILFVFGLITYYHGAQISVQEAGGLKPRQYAEHLICAVATTLCCYVLFSKVLTVVLPGFSLF